MTTLSDNTYLLSEVPAGTLVKILSFDLPEDIEQRILEMGLMEGTECKVERYAPLGDPMEIKLRGYHLSIRRSEAQGIRVQRL